MRSPKLVAPLHALIVLVGYSILFGWVFGHPLREGTYMSEGDLYDWFLPIFLSKFSLWSHEMFGGVPLFADTSDSQYYAVHFLFSHVLHWWTGYIAAAYVIASSCMYAYVFHRTRSKLAAALAGTAYGLSGPLVQRMAHINIAHGAAWFPLFILAIDEVLHTGSRRWIAIGAFAEANIFLSGHPQPILYASTWWFVYALVGAIAMRVPATRYAHAAAMFVLGVLLTAIKALPFLEASTFMARQNVTYDRFIDPAQQPLSMLGMLFPRTDDSGLTVPLYVGIGIVQLAILGFAVRQRDWRARVWAAAALIIALVTAGNATPVAWLVYHIPGYNLFRISSRMLFVYAAAMSALAGFAVAAVQRRQARLPVVGAVGGATLAATFAAGVIILHVYDRPSFAVQFGVVMVTAMCVLLASRLPRPAPLLVAIIGINAADLVYNSTFPVTALGLHLQTIDPRDTQPSVHAHTLASMTASTRQRLLSVTGSERDPIVPGGMARYWGMTVAHGFSPIMTNRLATLARMGASGDVYPDVFKFDDRSLDLLAVKYIIVGQRDFPAPDTFSRKGIEWVQPPLGFNTGRADCDGAPARRLDLKLPDDVRVSSIAFVAYLRCAEAIPQDATVATVDVIDRSELVLRQPIAAGVQIGDKYLSAEATRRTAGHRVPGTLFPDPELKQNSYLVSVDLPHPVAGAEMRITTSMPRGWMTVERMTLIDDARRSHPQDTAPLLLADRRRWQSVMQFRSSRETDRGRDESRPDETSFTIYENRRALPRVWIVGATEPVDEAAAIDTVRYSQFRDGRPFDPERIALVEPGIGGATTATFASGRGSARLISIDGDRMTVDVSADGAAFLVLSEAYYPGWRARIDDSVVPVQKADVMFQGVAVPAGHHTIVFELASATLRAGIAISVMAAAVVIFLMFAPVTTAAHGSTAASRPFRTAGASSHPVPAPRSGAASSEAPTR